MQTETKQAIGADREFLLEQIASYRKKHPSISLRSIARKAGFKSPATLSMILSQKRVLSLNAAERLAAALGLKGKSKSLLLAYARLDTARTPIEREKAAETIVRLKSTHPEFQIEAKQFSFLSTWYYPAIYTMIGNPAFKENHAQIAERLGRGVRKQDVSTAIETIIDLGLIKRSEGGRLQQTNAAISTPDEVRDEAVSKYHRNMTELAISSLGLPLSDREFSGLTVTIPRNALSEVKERIRRFRSDLNEYLSALSEDGEVFQCNMQLFPLTKGSQSS